MSFVQEPASTTILGASSGNRFKFKCSALHNTANTTNAMITRDILQNLQSATSILSANYLTMNDVITILADVSGMVEFQTKSNWTLAQMQAIADEIANLVGGTIGQ